VGPLLQDEGSRDGRESEHVPRRLQTDHVDCLLVHEVGRDSSGEGIERLKNPELFKAMEQAKSQGKARFFGCSGHDGDLMEVMEYAITIPEFSVILCRFNFMTYPTEPELFKKAKAAGVGVVAMKTLAGARGADVSKFRDRQTTFKQAALKWTLSNPDVANLIISISDRSQVDEYVQASGSAMTVGEADSLREYERLFAREVCTGCNLCESACPTGVPVADILRFRMYEKEYGWTGEGRRFYAAIDGGRFTARAPRATPPAERRVLPGSTSEGKRPPREDPRLSFAPTRRAEPPGDIARRAEPSISSPHA
jgi:predicted aldo/keto reductase-like oxidoreductase